MNAGLVETESAATYAAKAVAWDSKEHLELALPFQDLKPTIYLGEMVLQSSCCMTPCLVSFSRLRSFLTKSM